ncbi:MAG: hypothetical protein H0V18_12030 [Pyrinomonadaceae bacterium]|nr:hypothetical protein [Pyrinomonadaceae bacterium]
MESTALVPGGDPARARCLGAVEFPDAEVRASSLDRARDGEPKHDAHLQRRRHQGRTGDLRRGCAIILTRGPLHPTVPINQVG